MARKSSAIDQEQTRAKEKQPSREEINAALARLEKIAENLPPVDAVAIVREGRDIGSIRNR
jgi:hypothetical protein